jgi:uncharacterized iron-regulated membrane protein
VRPGALWPRVNRWLTWFHRWAGVILSLLFAIWFASGAVLHFVGFPALTPSQHLAGSETIDFRQLRVAPEAALERASAAGRVRFADGLRLISVAERPIYIVSSGGTEVAIAGDTGEVIPAFSARTAGAVAAQFGHGAVAGIAGPMSYDQWVVHQQFDPYRPFFRVRLRDAQHTDLYVSARTGEVVQRTTGTERLWNWCGAVIHWIYFTPIRADWSLWNQLVWWVSLAALLTSIAGTWLGLHRYLKNRASGRAGLSPFRGWMRWHHVIGLFASIVVLGWMFSGWLSMDHGRLFSRAGVAAAQSERMRGMPLSAIAEATTLEMLRSLGPAAVIELNAVAGQPLLTIRGGAGSTDSRLLWIRTGQRSAAPIPSRLLLTGLEAVWPATQVIPIDQSSATDELYRLAESVPDDALAARAGKAGEMGVYVDRFSGQLLAVMDPSRRVYAWVYYGLHTLNFPGLISHPNVRTGLEMLLLACGLGFIVTGIVLGIRRLRLEFS